MKINYLNTNFQSLLSTVLPSVVWIQHDRSKGQPAYLLSENNCFEYFMTNEKLSSIPKNSKIFTSYNDLTEWVSLLNENGCKISGYLIKLKRLDKIVSDLNTFFEQNIFFDNSGIENYNILSTKMLFNQMVQDLESKIAVKEKQLVDFFTRNDIPIDKSFIELTHGLDDDLCKAKFEEIITEWKLTRLQQMFADIDILLTNFTIDLMSISTLELSEICFKSIFITGLYLTQKRSEINNYRKEKNRVKSHKKAMKDAWLSRYS